MGSSVLIVGSGIAGLASALRLTKQGYDVTIVEKNELPGGRVNKISCDGFTFDSGPTFFSMSYEFERFAQECNIKLPFTYHAVDPLYTVNFGQNKPQFVLYRDLDKLSSQFETIEPDFRQKIRLYLEKTGKMFDDTIDIVVQQNFRSIFDYICKLSTVNKKHLPVLMSSLQAYVSKHFSSAEARQIISLIAYFLGNPPKKTNAVYSLLSYTEFIHDGYHNVEGGMYKIITGLVDELKKENITIKYNTEIKGVVTKGDTLTAIIDQAGNHYQADQFIINMDAALFRGIILNRPQYSTAKLAKKNWSMGMITLYVGLDCLLPNLPLHNYFIGLDEQSKGMKGFKDSALPSNPYFYVNVASHYNRQCAPDGCEALVFVIPVPNLLYKKNWDDTDLIVQEILTEFGCRIHFPIISHIKTLKVMTPENWRDQYNLYMGAALGLSHTMNQTGALRPQNEDEVFHNLYYTGASTIPGIGLPMAIISSRLTCERLISKTKTSYSN